MARTRSSNDSPRGAGGCVDGRRIGEVCDGGRRGDPRMILIGTSGWQYDWWRGAFYPPDVPKSRWLEYFVTRFPTVELNNSFYRLPSERAFEAWRRRTPEG